MYNGFTKVMILTKIILMDIENSVIIKKKYNGINQVFYITLLGPGGGKYEATLG
jgi:hypothetical protein